jgi:hypothetical protein
MIKVLVAFVPLFCAAFMTANATVKLAMHDAQGAGKMFLPDGRPVICFAPDEVQGAAATWTLNSPLEPGWHTVELSFGPEEKSRKLIDLECLDPDGTPTLSVNLYHVPSKMGSKPSTAIGVYLTKATSVIRWRKNQSRAMKSAPLLGMSIHPGRPGQEQACMEVVVAPSQSGKIRIPENLGGGLIRAVSAHPVSLNWSQADGKSFTTPQSVETNAYLDANLTDIKVSGEPVTHIQLERRFESKSPIEASGLDRPVIPLFGDGRRQHRLEIIGTDLDPASVRLADFPNGATMAAVLSWDDGIPQDKPAAELMHRHGWRASFFFNRKSPMVERWKELEDLGMEVASHSWSHPFYPLQSPERCRDESVLMRLFLESKVGHPVISFAYPFNYGPAYDSRGDYVLRSQQEAGYLSGRSTMNGPLALDALGEPLAMKTDAHFLAGRKVIEAAWNRAASTPRGVFYVWGHTYEIVSKQDWAAFEAFLKSYGRRPNVWYASQGDLMVWKHLRDSAKLDVSGDAGRLIIRVDCEDLDPWWAGRIPMAIRVGGNVTRVTRNQKAFPVTGDHIEFSLIAPIAH